jgi:hypothetical protein
MRLHTTMLAGGLSLFAAAAAGAQSSTVTVGPDGTLRGSTSVPGAPPVEVEAGNGEVKTTPPPGPHTDATGPGPYAAGSGRSVTVRSPDGSASASASATGDDAAVAGSGSPGSRVTVSPDRPSAGSGSTPQKERAHRRHRRPVDAARKKP